jgi:hypothetical protein
MTLSVILFSMTIKNATRSIMTFHTIDIVMLSAVLTSVVMLSVMAPMSVLVSYLLKNNQNDQSYSELSTILTSTSIDGNRFS